MKKIASITLPKSTKNSEIVFRLSEEARQAIKEADKVRLRMYIKALSGSEKEEKEEDEALKRALDRMLRDSSNDMGPENGTFRDYQIELEKKRIRKQFG